MTNADKIRAMSDEELIFFLTNTLRPHPCVPAPPYKTEDECISKICAECWDEWLHEEVKKPKTCFDCKHHFMSDFYLECDYDGIMKNSEICERFEEKENDTGRTE